MGLLTGLTKLITLPVKVVTLPVRATEKLFDEREQPISTTIKKILDKVEEAAADLDE